jgi:hypothetical protein
MSCGSWGIEHRATWYGRLAHWATTPSATTGMRDMAGMILLVEGIARLIDGALFATPTMDFVPTRWWGLAEILVAVLLLATRSCTVRKSTRGRIAASLACGFCFAFAYAVFANSASSAFVHVIIGAVLALEAQVHECK